MTNVDTFDLLVSYDGQFEMHVDISRVAVKRFISYYKGKYKRVKFEIVDILGKSTFVK